MLLNTETNDIFSFNDKEKMEIEEMLINNRMMNVIKDLMREHGIKTKSELAKKLGVTGAYVSKVFRSDKNFNVNFLVRAERVFDTTFTFTAKSLEEKNTVLNNFNVQTFKEDYTINRFIIDSSDYDNINTEAKIISLTAYSEYQEAK